MRLMYKGKEVAPNPVDKVEAGNMNPITSNAVANELDNYAKKVELENLSAVAKSGSYNDLINKPAIPTNTNQLTNGAGYITSAGSCAACTNADKIDGFHVSWDGTILNFNT